MNPIIKIEHLAAGYEGKEVLHDINLTIYQDDYLGIIGPNGGGKTTLMRLILGLMNPTEGNISYYKDGKPVKEITMDTCHNTTTSTSSFPSLYTKWCSPDSTNRRVSLPVSAKSITNS